MPSETNKIQRKKEEAQEGELPYISKSRLLTYVKCPRNFYYTYVLGRRSEETDAMRQGTRVHYTYEVYYENLLEAAKDGSLGFPTEPKDLTRYLPDDVLLWADWTDMVSSFIAWEMERLNTAKEYVDEIGYDSEPEYWGLVKKNWLPDGVEAEGWLEKDGPDWMGFADVIVPSASIKEVSGNDGVVIVDFKTGSTPDPDYREKGIFLQGEYYGIIFEQDYTIDGVAGYYPKNHDFLVEEPSLDRRALVHQNITEINELMNTTGPDMNPEMEDFGISPGALCHWGDGKCDNYDDCESDWGEGFENPETFKAMVESGYEQDAIAEHMEIETYWDMQEEFFNPVWYTEYKLKKLGEW